jgi:hypothetical protein
MLTKKVVFVSAQPDVPYFHWQVEVMIHNFMKVGINPNWIEVLWAHDGAPSHEVAFLAQKYPQVRFFFYRKRITENHGYIPILRPDILEQHFRAYPELRGEVIFYHDSDIIFRELPDFEQMHKDHHWYMSDTISYIGADYIKSKSPEIFTDLCEIAKIEPSLVEENQPNSGGAQYLMKGVTPEYWAYVKETALEMYKYMAKRESLDRSKLSPEELKTFNPIQKWCADMWAVFWGALRSGVKVKLHDELGFSWGTSSLDEYERHKIMHNAGVTGNSGGKLFYKGEFIGRSPFDADLSGVDKTMASSKYVEAILYAKERRK